MKTKFTYWQEADGTFLGYLNDDPVHWTQGESLEDLKEHLRDLHRIFYPNSPLDPTPDKPTSSAIACL